MRQKLEKTLKEALDKLGVKDADFILEHPSDSKNGDYSTNVAIKYGHKEELLEYLNKHKPSEVEKIELAGPGFINFYLSKEFFKKSLAEIIKEGENFGRSEHAKGFKIMVEHTDPNPFKEFHIGHLMPCVLGTALSKVFEWNGAEVKQANYQGDVGLHVAKAIWAAMRGAENPYVFGNEAYERDEKAKKEIEDINRKIYNRTDEEINKIYEKGRRDSLFYFENIYKKLGAKFDYYFFESETGEIGKKMVEENVGKVFEKSEGAIVFKGSHTRVFINSQGLPTYEAKDLGNAKLKYEKYPYDLSVIVTGNEIKDYFRVVLEAMKLVLPDLAKKTKHIPHGMLRFSDTKMSSRTGNIITAEALINEVKKKVKDDERVAIGAIKYMILRQAIGSDIIFDIAKSVSVEGDSGVYLQYAYARSNSLLEKAEKKPDIKAPREKNHEIEKLLYRFPEIIERAGKEYAPQYLATYLTELASSFNNFYAHEEVIGDSPEAPYRLAIVKAFNIVMKNGLEILGIPAPERL
ncbi:MAG: arginine--tRNA ligase [Minisyncoccia bacterium]